MSAGLHGKAKPAVHEDNLHIFFNLRQSKDGRVQQIKARFGTATGLRRRILPNQRVDLCVVISGTDWRLRCKESRSGAWQWLTGPYPEKDLAHFSVQLIPASAGARCRLDGVEVTESDLKFSENDF